MHRAIRALISICISVAILQVTGCTAEKVWSEGVVTAPHPFTAWKGGPSISLPSSITAFEQYLASIHAESYRAGAIRNAEISYVPHPRFNPTCGTNAAIIADLPFEEGQPRFVGYVSKQGVIECVENQTIVRGL